MTATLMCRNVFFRKGGGPRKKAKVDTVDCLDGAVHERVRFSSATQATRRVATNKRTEQIDAFIRSRTG